MYQLKIGSINLPEIYVSETEEEDKVAVENGFPFISWRGDKEKLIKVIMLPYLEKMFPGIKWMKVLNIKGGFVHQPVIKVPSDKHYMQDEESIEQVDIDAEEAEFDIPNKDCSDQDDFNVMADIADSERSFSGVKNSESINNMTVGEVLWSRDCKVNIEELQNLKLMPVFLDDVISSIKVNLQGMDWRGGYDKKLGACLGLYDQYNQPDNLIILDISASIPRGISDTMLTLLATFKEQLKADVIVTGVQSYYWAYEDNLPSPSYIRRHIGCGNEEMMFTEIMKTRIAHRKFGHVISFGDDDSPEWFSSREVGKSKYDGLGIEVGDVWHFHTWKKQSTGYAKWADNCCKGEKHFNNAWCDCMIR